MNNNDMNDMLKKAQEMIQNNEIPDDLKNMIANFQNQGKNASSSQSSIKNSSENSTYNQNSNNNSYYSTNTQNKNVHSQNKNGYEPINSQPANPVNSSNQSIPNMDISNIDIGTLMKLQKVMSKLKSSDGGNDDMSKLLLSLKPYLRDEKKGKIDEYIQLMKMGQMTQLFETLNGDKNGFK